MVMNSVMMIKIVDNNVIGMLCSQHYTTCLSGSNPKALQFF